MGAVILAVRIARHMAMATPRWDTFYGDERVGGVIADHPIGFVRGCDGDSVCCLSMPSYRVANN